MYFSEFDNFVLFAHLYTNLSPFATNSPMLTTCIYAWLRHNYQTINKCEQFKIYFRAETHTHVYISVGVYEMRI